MNDNSENANRFKTRKMKIHASDMYFPTWFKDEITIKKKEKPGDYLNEFPVVEKVLIISDLILKMIPPYVKSSILDLENNIAITSFANMCKDIVDRLCEYDMIVLDMNMLNVNQYIFVHYFAPYIKNKRRGYFTNSLLLKPGCTFLILDGMKKSFRVPDYDISKADIKDTDCSNENLINLFIPIKWDGVNEVIPMSEITIGYRDLKTMVTICYGITSLIGQMTTSYGYYRHKFYDEKQNISNLERESEIADGDHCIGFSDDNIWIFLSVLDFIYDKKPFAKETLHFHLFKCFKRLIAFASLCKSMIYERKMGKMPIRSYKKMVVFEITQQREINIGGSKLLYIPQGSPKKTPSTIFPKDHCKIFGYLFDYCMKDIQAEAIKTRAYGKRYKKKDDAACDKYCKKRKEAQGDKIALAKIKIRYPSTTKLITDIWEIRNALRRRFDKETVKKMLQGRFNKCYSFRIPLTKIGDNKYECVMDMTMS